MKFEFVQLPYATDALEPIISKQTIERHHGKHLQTYVNNLNNLIQGTLIHTQQVLFNTFCWSLSLFICCSCDNTEDNNSNSNDTSTLLEMGQVVANVYPDKDKRISFWASSQTLIIDWGDGAIDELTPNGVMKEFSHEYANQNLQTIKISSKDLTAIGGSKDFPAMGAFQELRFAHCPKLQSISCINQPLTVLELEKAESLVWVDCSNNQLSSNVLNNLFQKLPEVKEGYIYYKGNIGAENCDFSIAGNKGWKEDEVLITDITEETFFSKEENIIAALNSARQSEETFMQSWKLFESLYSNSIEVTDLLLNNSQYKRIYNHELNAADNLINNLWTNAYQTIRRSNVIIDKVALLNKPEYRKYINAALALRASAYWILVNGWGNVPFLDESNYTDLGSMMGIARTAESEILSVLVQNLLQTEDNLLLAKIYTYQKEYEKSLVCLAKLASSDNNEVYLLSAENNLQLNSLQDAIALVNIVRTNNNRSELKPNATVAQITDAILEEYKLDLRETGTYFFALKRFDRAESVLNIASYQKLLPIPIQELALNPYMIQNPGY
jgi:hypothetical protein